MPLACFMLGSVPRNIEELIHLLKECTPGNMRPLKECLAFAVERSGDSLDLEVFVEAIAYPIQSYKMTSAAKIEFFLEVKRLYPCFSILTGNNERDIAATKSLMLILKRINPGQHPVALDALTPYPALELSQDCRVALLGGIMVVGKKNYPVTGIFSQINCKPEERYSKLLPKLRGRSDLEMAAHYQAILNLLYLETVQLRKAWEVVLLTEVDQKFSGEYYTQVKEMVRLSMELEQNFTPRSDDNEEDFAFALQSKEIEKQVLGFLKSNDRSQHRALLELYRILLTLPNASEHSRVQDLLKFIKKEMAMYECITAYLAYTKFVCDDMDNSVLTRFCAAIPEDFIAPCNSILLSEMKRYEKMSIEAVCEYRVTQRVDPQHQVNIKEICKLYPTIAASQRDMYSYVYQLLQNLIQRQKKRLPFMQYLKCVLPDLEVGNALPEKLPEVTMLPGDLSIKMLRDLDKPIMYDWPKITAIPKVIPKQSKHKKTETKPQRDEKKELSSLSLVEKIPAEIEEDDDDDVEEIPVAQEVRKLVSLPLPPAPFVYAFRVFRWFDKASIPLDTAFFSEYATASETYQRLMVAYHAFTSSVDFFIIDMALKTVWPNPTTGHSDTRYILPAEISIPNLNKRARGIFSYCVGQDRKLYHRFFSEKPTEEIVKKITYNSFNAVDFPSLSPDPQLDKIEEYVPSTNPTEKIVKRPLLGTVSIENQQTSTKITLFPVTPETLVEAAIKSHELKSVL